MNRQTTLVPLDDYLHTMYEPDREYTDGELIERNMGESDHSALQGVIVAWLRSRRQELGIFVFPEVRTQISASRFRIPDIAVTTHKVTGRVLTEPPFLCIEILSPEDRADRLEHKIDDYLNFGVPHIWVIDPQKRLAWIYTQEGGREAAELLTTKDPTMEMPLNDVFSELDEQVEI